ncbi:transmembrane protein 209-like [Mya arenaria]|uniref:transmembrane protein 209-like n=1 Tax=Mya arenaria TaxID=6604 RepID=UPI0022E26823|nr:transmembrane protein 209-like [Mya arenaria]
MTIAEDILPQHHGQDNVARPKGLLKRAANCVREQTIVASKPVVVTSPSDKMTDLQSLSTYLKEQDEKYYKAALNIHLITMSLNSSSFWSYGRPSLDLIRKNQYKLASRSSQSHKSRTDDSDNMGEEVWRPLGVTDDDLFLWIERLRKKQDANSVPASIPSRLYVQQGVPGQEEEGDGCVSEFLWTQGGGGGQYGKPWSEHLPTDTQLVMHMFCTYLDSRLPPDLRYPDGKTFTSQHFLKTPDKPNMEKENLLLYQTSINPPHFQVVNKDTVFNLPKGRNNMFHAILFFLYHIQHKENGMLE